MLKLSKVVIVVKIGKLDGFAIIQPLVLVILFCFTLYSLGDFQNITYENCLSALILFKLQFDCFLRAGHAFILPTMQNRYQ